MRLFICQARKGQRLNTTSPRQDNKRVFKSPQTGASVENQGFNLARISRTGLHKHDFQTQESGRFWGRLVVQMRPVHVASSRSGPPGPRKPVRHRKLIRFAHLRSQ